MISTASSGLLPGPDTVMTSDPVRGPNRTNRATAAAATTAAIAATVITDGPRRSNGFTPRPAGTGIDAMGGGFMLADGGAVGMRFMGRVGGAGTEARGGGASDGPLRGMGGGSEPGGRL